MQKGVRKSSSAPPAKCLLLPPARPPRSRNCNRQQVIQCSLGTKSVAEARKLRTTKDLEWDARFNSYSKQVGTQEHTAGPTVSKLPPPSEEEIVQLVRNYIEQMDQRSRKRLAADPPENAAQKKEMWIDAGVEVHMLRDRDDPRGEQRVMASAAPLL
jgi:hypothetical protein